MKVYESYEVTPEIRTQVECEGRYRLSRTATVLDMQGGEYSYSDTYYLAHCAKQFAADVIFDSSRPEWAGYVATQSALSFRGR